MPEPSSSLTASELLELITSRRKTLILSALAGAVIALVGTLVVPRNWSSHQGLLIRSDAAGYSNQRLGKFTDLSEMKTVQETLLELAKSQSVVSAVLKEVGPSANETVIGAFLNQFNLSSKSAWPSPQDVVDFRDQLSFAPPGGAEFGKTEVFYVGVLDPEKERAAALVRALTKQLELRMQELRNLRASSLVDEVQHSVSVTRDELRKSVEQLTAFEMKIGADLVELRNMTTPIGGQSEFTQRALALEAEVRQLQQQQRGKEALLAELQKAGDDPALLVSTPDVLLVSQPGLRRLKNGLVEAQLAVARMGGARTSAHPYVRAARVVHEKTLVELANELPTAIKSVELDLEVSAKREAELTDQLETLRNRSAELAGLRTEYAELTADVDSQTEVLRRALAQLADAESHRAAAASTSLLSKIDGVESSVRPVGPSRKAVVGAGGLAGLLLATTLVLLFTSSHRSKHNLALEQLRDMQHYHPNNLNDPWAVEKQEKEEYATST